MFRSLLLLALFAMISVAHSRSLAVQAAIQQIAAPRFQTPPGNHQPIVIDALDVRVRVDGRIARIEWDFTFFNPNTRVMEGELQFPLAAAQSIDSFAMDVNGQLREAVPVEKAKGQQVFEDVIRQRIDPGLLSHTEGNNFKLRVYPIPAQGRKRAVIRIDESLDALHNAQRLRIPLQLGNRISQFSADVMVRGAIVAPRVSSGGLGKPLFERYMDGHRWTTRRTGFDHAQSLDIDWNVRGEPLVAVGRQDGAAYFYVEAPLPEALGKSKAARTIPKRIEIVWDASASRATHDHAREFALLDAYFARMGAGEVALSVVRDVVEPRTMFRVANSQWRELRAALAALVYDGATHLGAWTPDAMAREILLFSDGLSNDFGARFAQPAVPLYAINAATKSNPALLTHAAARTGGRFIDLTTEDSQDAQRALLQSGARLARIEGANAHRSIRVQPSVEQGVVRIAGWVSAPLEPLVLVFVDAKGRETRQNISLAIETDSSPLVPRRWARARLMELDAEHEVNRAEIRRLGKRFGMVTRETSLIVLDRIEDYAENEIEPPAELLADYQRLITQGAAKKSADRAAHLERVVRMFNDKVAWWLRVFPKERIERRDEPQKIAGAVVQAASRLSANAAQEQVAGNAPAAVASPAPMAPPSMPKRALSDSQLTQRAESKRESSTAQPTHATTIQLAKWSPDAPYVVRYRETATELLYRVYLDEKPSHPLSTAFILDSADALFERGLNALGFRVLSNLAEMDLENRHILRVLGYRLLQAKAPERAIPVLKKVLALAPAEPQSYRDLGLAYAANGEPQKAIDALYETVSRPWHGRFPEVELIALAELNAIVATANAKLDVSRIDPRLMKNLTLDLRAVLTWDADNTDIDLWITDPNGDKAYYGNRLTRQGGRMSLDFTGGYGPEEFSLKQAMPGTYKVEARYFGDRRQNVAGPTTLQVKLSTRFGTRDQKDELITMRLDGRGGTVTVGEFEVKAQ